MALVDDARDRTRQAGRPSAIDRLLSAVDDAERSEIMDALASDVNARALADAMNERWPGYRFSDQMLRRWRSHR